MRIALGLVVIAVAVASFTSASASYGRQDAPPPTVADRIADARYEAQVEVVNRLLKDHDHYDYHEIGNRLKGKGEYAEAAIYYLIALKLKPKQVSTMYELACNCSLWGQNDLALSYLAEAIDGGFWGHALMVNDDQLAPLHGEPLYEELLDTAKRRYATQATQHRGKTVVELPRGAPPAGGWPAVVMLHGYGASSSQFWQIAKNAASMGFAAICPAGPVVLFEKSYAWPRDDVAATHALIEESLADAGTPIDRRRLFLAGLSQGGHHAAALVAANPEVYGGALVIDPEGWAAVPDVVPDDTTPRLYLVSGTGVPAESRTLIDSWKALWQGRSLPLREREHGGGVGIPVDWQDLSTEAFRWLVGKGE